MNIISDLFGMYHVYEHTAIILGIESLVMGITLLMLSISLKSCGSRSRSGLVFLAVAMFVLCVINLIEYAIGVDRYQDRYSLAIVIFASSVELFVLFMAYMSMLCKGFVTRRRICIELVCIAIFTTPAIFVSSVDHPLYFDILFTVGVVFYSIKLAWNLYIYRKQIVKTRERVKDLLSDDSHQWLRWVNSTFYVVMAIGLISVVVPMTNLTVLVFYNTLLVLAYFYIYISIIMNISIFDRSMYVLDSDEMASQSGAPIQAEVYLKPPCDFMSTRKKFFDDWIATKGYTVTGVTATEVASLLNTNRTRLSQYLKHDLQTTYYEWIASLRITYAKEQLLQYPDRSIYEIAHNVGIEDRDNFRRVFQRYVGMSPTAYRREQLGHN